MTRAIVLRSKRSQIAFRNEPFRLLKGLLLHCDLAALRIETLSLCFSVDMKSFSRTFAVIIRKTVFLLTIFLPSFCHFTPYESHFLIFLLTNIYERNKNKM